MFGDLMQLFGTDGIRGKANFYPLTPEMTSRIGKAIALYFKEKKTRKKKAIVIGKDTRLSGYMLETALVSGIVSVGLDVFLVGPLPTPAISHLIKSLNCVAGIVVSASHNPAFDNGIKVFNEEGFKLHEKEEALIEAIIFNEKKLDVKITNVGKAYRVDDARGRYIEFLKNSIENESLKGLKIILDCANGAAYNIAPKVFSELGAQIKAINVQPDGLNINKNCGALYPEKLAAIVKKNKAHIGLAFDGDADRIIAIDEKGTILNGDTILAITALHLAKKRKLRKKAVVATVMSNQALIELFKKHKIKVFLTKVGDKYVIEELRKRRLCLGGEQSGHIIFFDYSVTGDAIIAGLQLAKVLIEENKKLSKLASILKPWPQTLINVKVKEKKPLKELSVFTEIKKAEKKLKGKGRILVRYSGTENILRIMTEGKNAKQIKAIAERIAKAVKKEIGV